MARLRTSTVAKRLQGIDFNTSLAISLKLLRPTRKNSIRVKRLVQDYADGNISVNELVVKACSGCLQWPHSVFDLAIDVRTKRLMYFILWNCDRTYLLHNELITIHYDKLPRLLKEAEKMSKLSKVMLGLDNL